MYFKSGDGRPITKDGIAKLGLAYAFPAGIEGREVTRGLDGKAGYIFADPNRHTESIGYFPDRQTWRKLPKVEGRPELWVGYWNEAKPGPGDLERPNQVPGEMVVTLGDGNQWMVPTLCEFDEADRTGPCELPAPLDYDEHGNLFTGKPTGEYGELWDAIHPVAVGLCFGSDDEDSEIKLPTMESLRDATFRLLRTNYVVSVPELVVLGCLRNDTTYRTIVMASCRGRWLINALKVQKKTNSASTEST